jgi:hypothetical protein
MKNLAKVHTTQNAFNIYSTHTLRLQLPTCKTSLNLDAGINGNHKAIARVIFAGSLLGALLLTGCGSGGGDQTQDNSPQQTTPPPIVVPQDTTPAKDSTSASASSSAPLPQASLTTKDLIAEESFTFPSQKEVFIKIIKDEYKNSTERIQVSLYSQYHTNPDASATHRYLPSFNHRIASGALINGQFHQTLTLPRTQGLILAELWRTDGSAPTQELISIDNE